MFSDDDEYTLWERLRELGVSLNFTPFNWQFYYDFNGFVTWCVKFGPIGITIWIS